METRMRNTNTTPKKNMEKKGIKKQEKNKSYQAIAKIA